MFNMTTAAPDEVRKLIINYHYSRSLPGNIVKCFALRGEGGLFGDFGDPLAAIVYSLGVNQNWPKDSIELGRLVRHPDLDFQLSQFVTWSLRWLRKTTDKSFVYSYADWTKNHHGGVYQASGFKYVYASPAMKDGIVNVNTGEEIHGRSLNNDKTKKRRFLECPDEWQPRYKKERYCYIFPLRMRFSKICKIKGFTEKPFPKPNATCPADETLPGVESREHPPKVAPISSGALT